MSRLAPLQAQFVPAADFLSTLFGAASLPTLNFLRSVTSVGLAVQCSVCPPMQASLAVVDLLPGSTEHAVGLHGIL